MENGLIVLSPTLLSNLDVEDVVDLDEAQLCALTLILKGNNVVIHGMSGTGKTTVINTLSRAFDIENKPNNFYGVHDLFYGPYKENPDEIAKAGLKYPDIVSRAKVIVVDDYTTIPASVIVALDMILRKYADLDEPFGGKQVVFSGDLYAYSSSDVYPVVSYHDVYLNKDYKHDEPLSEFLLGLVKIMRTNKMDALTSSIINHILYRAPSSAETIVCSTIKQVLNYNLAMARGHSYMLVREEGLKEDEIPNVVYLNGPVRFTHDVRDKRGELVIRRGHYGVLTFAPKKHVIIHDQKTYGHVTNDEEVHVFFGDEPVVIKTQKIGGEKRFPIIGASAITINDISGLDNPKLYIDTQCVSNEKMFNYIYSVAASVPSIYCVHMDKHSMELQQYLD